MFATAVTLQSDCWVADANEMGIGLALQGEVHEADSLFTFLMDLHPWDSNTLNNYGNVRIIAGDLELSLGFYSAAFEIDRDPGILLNRSLAYLWMGNSAAAVAAREQVMKLVGDWPRALELLAIEDAPSEAQGKGRVPTVFREEVVGFVRGAINEAALPRMDRRDRPRGANAMEVAEVLYWKRAESDSCSGAP